MTTGVSKETDSHHVEVSGNMKEDEATLHANKARLATEEEHSLNFFEAFKRYKMAWFWSSMVCLTIIMDGYDTALLGSLQAYPSFQWQFGHEVGDTGKYQLEAKWQVAIGLSTPLGNIVGVYLNSLATERWGHKKTLIGALIYLSGVIFIPFFSKNIEMLFVGELLCGIAWGVFTTMAPAYASEVCPVALRSYLECTVVLCWGIGQLLSFGVLSALSGHKEDPWAWRIPIAVQWFWPLLIVPIMSFAPESPWWLVRQGRTHEANKVLMRLSNLDTERAEEAVALMVQTNNLEKAMHEGTSVWDCFKGSNLWRTEIACTAWVIQQLSGFVVSGYGTYFFQQAGLATTESFHMSVSQGGIHFAVNLVAFWITGKFGRRKLFLWGVAAESMFWFLVGFAALAPPSRAASVAQTTMYMCWYTVYQLTIGPVVYIIIGESSTTRLRSQTIGLARNAYNIATIVNYCVGPYILNPTEGNWKGKCGFLTGGILVVCFIWAFFRLPEMRGRTYEELDILFSRGVRARDFAKASVDDSHEDSHDKELV
ncbi:hypothetical protein LB505_009944 [Fusarium chuoi]|nr:hypothetical protein LB505_009944 [Fusarium chuoi]